MYKWQGFTFDDDGTLKVSAASGGTFLAADGSAAAPSYSFANDTDTGIKAVAGDGLTLVTSGINLARFSFGQGAIMLRSTTGLTWSGGDPEVVGFDIGLFRDAANTLAQRNGANAQAFRIYDTFTDAANYSRLDILSVGSGDFAIGVSAAGTGVRRNIEIGTGPSGSIVFTNHLSGQLWLIPVTSGHFLAATDNVHDIGASGANRPRNLYVGTGLRVSEAANGKQGVATLVAGTVVVSNTSITANSRIFLTCQTPGGTPGFLRVSARTVGTSFTILSSSGTDTSVVAYEIFEPA